MAHYEIDALGGQFQMTVEAPDKQTAEKKALEQLKEQFRHTVSVTTFAVYEVRFNHNGTKANVLAPSAQKAEQAAQEWLKQKRDRAVDNSDLNEDALDLLVRDFDGSVECEGVRENATHYEIDPNGNWVDEAL